MRVKAMLSMVSAVLVGGLVTCSVASASTAQVGFEAVITDISDPFFFAPPTLVVGDTIFGFYEYELGAADSDPEPAKGLYRYTTPPSGLSINAKGYWYRTDPAMRHVWLTVGDSLFGEQAFDQYKFTSQFNLQEPLVLGTGAAAIWIELIDTTATALASDSLPVSPPELGAWGFAHYVVILGEGGYWITSDIISISAGNPTGIKERNPAPGKLFQNYPNPFNPNTTIRYSINEGSRVTLRVYDVAGRLVRTLVDDVRVAAVVHSTMWDGKNEAGEVVSSGIYFYRMTAGNAVQTKKLVFLK